MGDIPRAGQCDGIPAPVVGPRMCRPVRTAPRRRISRKIQMPLTGGEDGPARAGRPLKSLGCNPIQDLRSSLRAGDPDQRHEPDPDRRPIPIAEHTPNTVARTATQFTLPVYTPPILQLTEENGWSHRP
jgi:hypothetical protein